MAPPPAAPAHLHFVLRPHFPLAGLLPTHLVTPLDLFALAEAEAEVEAASSRLPCQDQ
jgi:hypothetical protein